MQTGLVLIILGLLQIYLGFYPEPVYRLFLWSGFSFVIAGLGYGRLGARVFGKRSDGAMAGWSVAALLPYLLFTWTLWHLQRLLSREDACNEVAPDIWIGRRPFPRELPVGITLIVDLTAEFPAARGIKADRTYLCLPTLDASVPSEDDLRVLLEQAGAWNGPIYVHCASGHGRSAMVVIAILLHRGIVGSIAEGEALVKKVRPRIGLSQSQRQLLERAGWG
jgi:protein-tyrosine phosphatase